MVKVHSPGLMVDDTKENGSRARCMVKENLHMKMVVYIKVVLRMI